MLPTLYRRQSIIDRMFDDIVRPLSDVGFGQNVLQWRAVEDEKEYKLEVALPQHLDTESIAAEVTADGVLRVTVPKPEPKRIEVNATRGEKELSESTS